MKEVVDKYIAAYPRYKEICQENIGLRTHMANLFAGMVADHVQNYTIPQYGDYPTDNITSWSVEDCLKQIQKYANRFFSNSRGEQELPNDLLKIAHYTGLAYLKLKGYEIEFSALVPQVEMIDAPAEVA